MPPKRAVTFAVSALQDLEEIRKWYNELQAPEVADELLAGIVLSVERLATFPESGRVVPEFGLRYLREIIRPPFRIVYRIDRNRVRIVRVWRSERLLMISH